MPTRPPVPRRARLLRGLLRDRKAATAVEYGLIVALIVVGVMAAITALGGQSRLTWGSIHDKVTAVGPS